MAFLTQHHSGCQNDFHSAGFHHSALSGTYHSIDIAHAHHACMEGRLGGSKEEVEDRVGAVLS